MLLLPVYISVSYTHLALIEALVLAEVLALVEALVLADVLALIEALVDAPVSYTHLQT